MAEPASTWTCLRSTERLRLGRLVWRPRLRMPWLAPRLVLWLQRGGMCRHEAADGNACAVVVVGRCPLQIFAQRAHLLRQRRASRLDARHDDATYADAR